MPPIPCVSVVLLFFPLSAVSAAGLAGNYLVLPRVAQLPAGSVQARHLPATHPPLWVAGIDMIDPPPGGRCTRSTPVCAFFFPHSRHALSLATAQRAANAQHTTLTQHNTTQPLPVSADTPDTPDRRWSPSASGCSGSTRTFRRS